jgi:hypothetical protein
MPFNPLSKRLLKNERKSIFYLMVLAGIIEEKVIAEATC